METLFIGNELFDEYFKALDSMSHFIYKMSQYRIEPDKRLTIESALKNFIDEMKNARSEDFSSLVSEVVSYTISLSDSELCNPTELLDNFLTLIANEYQCNILYVNYFHPRAMVLSTKSYTTYNEYVKHLVSNLKMTKEEVENYTVIIKPRIKK